MTTNAESSDTRFAAWQRFLFLQPTLALLLSLLVIVGGIFAASSMTKEALPDLSIPQATVTTTWPGADAQTIEQQITKPLEKELKTLKGLAKLNSASFASYSVIAVEFDANADLDQAMSQLRQKVDTAEADIANEAEKPEVKQASVDDRPILSIALKGDVSPEQMNSAADLLQDSLEEINGVNEVELGGDREEVIKILLVPERMQAFGISPTLVRDRVIASDKAMPIGAIEHNELGAEFRLAGRLKDVEDIENIPLTRLGDDQSHLVRLGQVATVKRELERVQKTAYLSWQGDDFSPTIELSVKKTPGADTIAVIESIRSALQDIEQSEQWPGQLKSEITQNGGTQITNSLNDVLVNGLQSMVAVFAVVLLMLTWREGLIAGLSIPISLLGALVIIWSYGFTLNELVIIGMVLALGLLVDVFILMMEGMHENIFVQKQPFNQAAINTLKTYALPAFAGTLTTVLALLPLMAIGGTAGKFIRVLPFSAIVCLVVALICALIVSVPISRYLLKNQHARKASLSRVDRLTASMSERLKNWSLRNNLASKKMAGLYIVLAFVVLLIGGKLFSTLPVVMYPKNDGLKMGIAIELPATTNLSVTQSIADEVGEYLRSKTYLESVVKLSGQKSPMTQLTMRDSLQPLQKESFIGFSLVFKPLEEREKSAYLYGEDILSDIRNMLNDSVSGATIKVVADTRQPETIAPIELRLSSDDFTALISISEQVKNILSGIDGLDQISSNLGTLQSQIAFEPDREALQFYGFTVDSLGQQLSILMGMNKIAEFQTAGTDDDLEIRLGTAWPHRPNEGGGPQSLSDIRYHYVVNDRGERVQLASLGNFSYDTRPQSILHAQGNRTISISVNDIGDRDLKLVAEEIKQKLTALKADSDKDFTFFIGGELEATSDTFGSAGAMLLVAVMLIYSVLVLFYSSFLQALIIVAIMPLSLIGTFYGFYLISYPFTFFSMVGIISLMGIVVNNAIVMVDTMNSRLAEGLSIVEAAAHGASDRIRPIISTSLTTIVGLAPLAYSSEMWRPLCFAIIFGLIGATVLSLLIVPCLYLLFTRQSQSAN